jgi:phosphoglycerol transferase MdoB-like AlkP superfamily enzyme
VLVSLAVWAKLVYFTVLLASEWWAPDASMREWMRPAFHVFRAVVAHPHTASATFGVLLLLIAVLPRVRRTLRFVLLLILDVFLTTLGLIDLVHVRFYADVVSIADLMLLPALGGVLPSILKLLHPSDALYYLDIVIGCAVLPAYVSACRRIAPFERHVRRGLSMRLAILGWLVVAPTAWMVWQNRSSFFSFASVHIEVASTLGILPYHFSDAIHHLVRSDTVPDEAVHERVRDFLKAKHEVKQVRSPLAGIARGRNLIVISAESLQAFPLNMEIDGQPVMPRLSAFAKESLNFVNFFDQTHLGTTSDAEFMAMQSLHPLPAGVLVSWFHHREFRGLPKVLTEHGYATVSLCAAPANFWYMDQMHARFGFQKSYFDEEYRVVERINGWLSDQEFFSQSIPKLLEQRQPFMAFMLSASNHHPYELPPAYRTLRLGKMEGTLLGDYLHSVHYFDQAFGAFLDKLRAVGLLDKTVILVYGDHQGFLGDPPELATLLGFSPLDDFLTVQTRKKVPLLIRLPHGRAAGVRSIAGGHLDMAPTLLSLLGIRDGRNVMLGSDLTESRDSLVVFRDGSFTDGTRYYMKRFGRVSSARCYNVKTGESTDCESLEVLRRAAVERLEISDLIVRGDLIPVLTGGAGEAARHARR